MALPGRWICLWSEAGLDVAGGGSRYGSLVLSVNIFPIQTAGSTTTRNWTVTINVELGTCCADTSKFQVFAVKAEISAICTEEDHCIGRIANC